MQLFCVFVDPNNSLFIIKCLWFCFCLAGVVWSDKNVPVMKKVMNKPIKCLKLLNISMGISIWGVPCTLPPCTVIMIFSCIFSFLLLRWSIHDEVIMVSRIHDFHEAFFIPPGSNWHPWYLMLKINKNTRKLSVILKWSLEKFPPSQLRTPALTRPILRLRYQVQRWSREFLEKFSDGMVDTRSCKGREILFQISWLLFSTLREYFYSQPKKVRI